MRGILPPFVGCCAVVSLGAAEPRPPRRPGLGNLPFVPPFPTVKDWRLDAQPHRRLHPRQAGSQGSHARAGSGSAHAASPAVVRPDRPAADAGRDRRLRATIRAPDAYEKVVDRLLASPHFGERWATHWLDLVRYAESDGFKADDPRPDAWRYRDYVIRSFNDDKPYDRFVREQLAGDELYPDDADAWIATGFLRHYPDEYNAVNLEQRRQEILNDITDTTAQVFLGLTVGCARCHDHKFDPIPQEDYYRLQAFFAAFQPTERPVERHEGTARAAARMGGEDGRAAAAHGRAGGTVPAAIPRQAQGAVSQRPSGDARRAGRAAHADAAAIGVHDGKQVQCRRATKSPRA